jgi:hypothetical protein
LTQQAKSRKKYDLHQQGVTNCVTYLPNDNKAFGKVQKVSQNNSIMYGAVFIAKNMDE